MSVQRQEFLDIISIVSHLALSDGEMAPPEKKILFTLFKQIHVTKEEQIQMKKKTSLEQMMKEITSDVAKNALIDTLALVAGADGKFEKEEKIFIMRIMKRLEMDPHNHPYFKDGNKLDIHTVRTNVRSIIENVKKAAS